MNITYDGKIKIATGRSKTTKTWKNEELTWSALLSRLSVTTRTRETVAEYKKAPKADRDNIKDVGGFVGGYLAKGIRKSSPDTRRSLITLDADYADKDFTTTLDLFLGGYAYCYYSTHTHTPEAPRLRVIIPLSREVTPEEYQAVARRIANDIGMDLFDDTTYEAERLMFWPSTSADGEFLFDLNDSEWLNPDDILKKYNDWTDSTSWPESSRAVGIRKNSALKQGDPLEKEGLIGAFCRTYSIEEAIATFLPEVYQPCDVPGRYTYVPGTTAGGLVLYDDKFAYSHHGTDPVSGLLVNAFDLVRLHKFGIKDSNPELAVNKQPSYKAMMDFVVKDAKVKETLVAERAEEVKENFAPVEDREWLSKLQVDKRGNIESLPKNIKLVLRNDPKLAGKIGVNDFDYKTEVLDDLPWRKQSVSKLWTDRDDSCLRNYLSEVYGIKGKDVIYDGFADVFESNHFHPVRDFILSHKWDGQKRAESLWIDYLGAENSEYVRAVTRKHLTAAVARVFRPGCKFDNVIILAGAQGIGKSTMLKLLGGEWFNDTFTTVQGKEAYEQLLGSWIIEVGEMYATKKAESEAVKQFLSKSEDTYRAAYGRRVMTYPRQCVFYGTTNDNLFLRDRTGNRRFWPVEVSGEGIKSFRDLDKDTVGQIWAEAYTWYKAGEKLYLSKEMEKEAAKHQEAHQEVSDKVGLIEEYLDVLLPEDWYEKSIDERKLYFANKDQIQVKGVMRRTRVCALEIWCEALGGNKGQSRNMDSREINGILANMPEWRGDGRKRYGPYGTQRGFKRTLETSLLD